MTVLTGNKNGIGISNVDICAIETKSIVEINHLEVVNQLKLTL